jgi:hypothetical protein
MALQHRVQLVRVNLQLGRDHRRHPRRPVDPGIALLPGELEHLRHRLAEDTELEEGDVIEALAALEPVWDELYPAEQARILRLLIERIDVAPDGISVTLYATGIRSLVAELADQEAPALVASDPLLEAAEQ